MVDVTVDTLEPLNSKKFQSMCKIEVIVSTYNNLNALNLCLSALNIQTYTDFNICVADDGSSSEVNVLISKFKNIFKSRFRYLWQPDLGFRKNQILNKAIETSEADYLIFIDGDCISFPGFVERHLQMAMPGRFCTGGVCRLNEKVTSSINESQIYSGEIYRSSWLNKFVLKGPGIGARLKAGVLPFWFRNFFERITPVKKTWNGGNSSAWKADLLLVNGFNNDLRYGGEDVEMGVRLNNNNIQGRHLRYTANLLHLEHPRSYVDIKQWENNRRFIKEIANKKIKFTNNGIYQR